MGSFRGHEIHSPIFSKFRHSFNLCSSLEAGPGEDIQHKDFLKFPKQKFSLHLGKSRGCRHEGIGLSSMMPFPGHWCKEVGGVRGDGGTRPFVRDFAGGEGYVFLPSSLRLWKLSALGPGI